jgi:hypothetical protein
MARSRAALENLERSRQRLTRHLAGASGQFTFALFRPSIRSAWFQARDKEPSNVFPPLCSSPLCGRHDPAGVKVYLASQPVDFRNYAATLIMRSWRYQLEYHCGFTRV